MRRKFISLLLLGFACFAYADEVQLSWLSPLVASGSNCQTMIQQILTNEQGEGFVLSSYGTLTNEDEASFLGDTFGGAEYGTGTSYNKNVSFCKFDLQGRLLWHVYSIDGDYQDGCFYPTRDGGAVMAVKFRLSFRNKVPGQEGEQCHLIDAAGKSYVATAVYEDALYYSTFLFRLNAAGEIMATRVLDADVKASEPLTIRAIAEDENGQIYLAGSTSEQHGTLLKFDAGLQEKGALVIIGNTQDDRWNGLLYNNGKLYLSGNAKCESATELICGGKTTLVSELGFIHAQLDTALECEYFTATPILRHNDKQSYLFYQMQWSADKQSYYISGGLMGGLMVGDQFIHAGGEVNSTMNDGYTLRIDGGTGNLENAVLTGSPTLNLNQGVIERGDSIYIVGYQFGTVWMKRYDKQMNYLDERLLATGGGMCTVVAVASYGDDVLIGLRSQRGQDFAVLGQIVNEDVQWYGTMAAFSFADDDTAFRGAQVAVPAVKIVRNGQLLIVRENEIYTILGNKIL